MKIKLTGKVWNDVLHSNTVPPEQQEVFIFELAAPIAQGLASTLLLYKQDMLCDWLRKALDEGRKELTLYHDPATGKIVDFRIEE